MIGIEAVEAVVMWESPSRVSRLKPFENWWLWFKGGVRHSSTSYKDRADYYWWWNPWAIFRILGLEIGFGFALAQLKDKTKSPIIEEQ